MHLKLASCGNPNKGQDPDRPVYGTQDVVVSVSNYKEASEICRKWIVANNIGSGNWAGGEIIQDGVFVARVSYNGRVWNKNNNEIIV